MSKGKILVVDDEVHIRRLVSDFLKKEGFEVVEAADGEQALLECNKQIKELLLVILDVMMPKLDGFEVLDEIRSFSDIPVIMLTARSQEYDQLKSFRHGADDYLSKPFSPTVLVARVLALLKRTGKFSDEIITFGKLTINEKAHEVMQEGRPIELTPKEYNLLLYFINNEGVALTRDKILTAVWSYDYYGDLRTVDTHVKQLRSKINAKGASIDTVRGVGYKFKYEEN